MTAPTDLRAALRDKLIAAYDAAWDTTGEGKNAEYTGPRYTQDAYERERAEAIDKILADTPPTVAELLPMVDATHEVRWQCSIEAKAECRAVYADGNIAIQWRHPGGRWRSQEMTAADLIQPGRLVEVSP